MTFSMTNFIHPVRSDEVNPWNGVMQKALSSYKELSQAPYIKPMLQEALTKQQLYNKYYGKEKESEIGLRGAQAGHLGSMTRGQDITNQWLPDKLRLENEKAQFLANNPLLSQTGVVGQVGASLYLQQHPELRRRQAQQQGQLQEGQSSIASIYPQQQGQMQDGQSGEFDPIAALQESIKNSFKPKGSQAVLTPLEKAKIYRDHLASTGASEKDIADANKQITNLTDKNKSNPDLKDYREKMLLRKHWDSLPSDTKANLIATGQGMGMTADEVEKSLTSGQSIQDLMFSRGYDLEHPPEPIYQLTNKNITDLNQREYASREVKYLSDFVTRATGDYSRTVAGYSFKQIKDGLTGRNEDQQAKYLAARMVSQELVNLRLLLGGAKSTVAAQKHLLSSSMQNNKVFESLVKPSVWEKMQKIADKELQNAFQESKKGYGQPSSGQKTESKIDDSSDKLLLHIQKSGKSTPEAMSILNKLDKVGTKEDWEHTAKEEKISIAEAKKRYYEKHFK
jgi:hypothetical protein